MAFVTRILLLLRFNVACALFVAAPGTTLSPSQAGARPVTLLTRHHDDGGHDANTSSDAQAYCGFHTRLMVECAELLYRTYDHCGCWRKVMSFTAPSDIVVAAYHHGNQCLLGVSGQLNGADRFTSNTTDYLRKHDPFFGEQLCSRWTVHGFVMQTKKIFSLKRWVPLANFLSSASCSGGVSVIGQSWGGAIAEVLAGCANQGQLAELQGSALPTFRVDRLYTFGAPPTALKPISDYASATYPCFAGQRVFLASQSRSGATDLIAYSTGINGYAHARQDAIQLIEMSDGRFKVVLHACQSEKTSRRPDWDTVYPFLEELVKDHGDSASDFFQYGALHHQISAYVNGLRMAYDPFNLLGGETSAANLMVDAGAADAVAHEAMGKSSQGEGSRTEKAAQALAFKMSAAVANIFQRHAS